MKHLILMTVFQTLITTHALAKQTAAHCAPQISSAVLAQDPRAYFGGSCVVKHIELTDENQPASNATADVVCTDDSEDQEAPKYTQTYDVYLEFATCRVYYANTHHDRSGDSENHDDHNGCFRKPGNHCK